ncbi:hypothetical protein PN465_07970 [Nodularia spumigena CS-584]|mgnify:CR=1 FL=1|jgi:hypothetical protein|uniref:Low temperature-induced protein n=2 Tax=Nodularia spumigena TaxID=70799 RepID=A0A2S0PYX0_NODSP|nr:hypothetical protein [Nodularia spumigena]AHJ26962.1 conserved hypothetical low temperature-induced protein [Nodularia spumigena CCY9414]AVZ29616.1 hypothetical protein BMF81_00352 [Nodularia spumigena UHCC 0039]EAW45951.1 conserved hypothetical low temperature-induced protein [Nodularia spumigena CCY9414]MDB9316257.1 hypothetical protein [Nodularia spumigena CS-590/01A]MDB9325041.1 hypothetical protein [Nodularia spumigena CS-590/02]
MKIVDFVLSILRPVRFVVVASACTLLFLSSVSPAFAISSYQSDPQEGPTQLLETQRRTDEVAKSQPLKLKEVQENSNKGLNEVQGDADIDKMKNPENSQSSTSVEDNVQNFLEKVTGKK